MMVAADSGIWEGTWEYCLGYWEGFQETLSDLDIDYWRWVLWVVYPIILSFLLPILILLFLYCSAFFLHLYNYRHNFREAYNHDIWDGARTAIAAAWDAQGRIWHGFEIDGLEKIPDAGAALIVYYHGTLPIDFYYLAARCLLEKKRHIRAVGDNFLFHIPGLRRFLEVFRVTPGTIQSCVSVLKDGHLLAIAPGGVREALFGDENYPIMWGKRQGFAKAAIQANVPIIPVFTQNVREAFRTPKVTRSCLRRIYEKTRLPIVPIYGFFPVKFKMFVGDPIYPSEDKTSEALANEVMTSVGTLIYQHQRLPGNILCALVDRLG
uniref:Transmembrane protein 68-like isoform X2 n=1 Tax=Crassostrea virginica TaxID=6565 RepID=A0A8B8CEZ9_CRAVI|nr:transmembrane protein 68-like isoform X2 [Crassostrea virginica]